MGRSGEGRRGETSVGVRLPLLGSVPRQSEAPEGQPVAARCDRSPGGGTVALSRAGLLRPVRPADGRGLSQRGPDGELLRVLLGGQPVGSAALSAIGGTDARRLGRRAGAGGPGAGGAGAELGHGGRSPGRAATRPRPVATAAPADPVRCYAGRATVPGRRSRTSPGRARARTEVGTGPLESASARRGI